VKEKISFKKKSISETINDNQIARKISVEDPDSMIPNPGGNGISQTNGQTVFDYINELCLDADWMIQDGRIELLDTAFCFPSEEQEDGTFKSPSQLSAHPISCECLCETSMDPLDNVVIRINDHDEGTGSTNDNSGGTIINVPSPNAKESKVMGASGTMVDSPPFIILAHELCGHHLLNRHGNDDENMLNDRRGGHDPTINRENEIRNEHGIDQRGTFRDPCCGLGDNSPEGMEGTKHPCGKKFEEGLTKHRRYAYECKHWRDEYNKLNNTSFQVEDAIPIMENEKVPAQWRIEVYFKKDAPQSWLTLDQSLTDEGKTNLGTVEGLLIKHPDWQTQLAGNASTDKPANDPQYNTRLANRRVVSVKDELLTHGASDDRLVTFDSDCEKIQEGVHNCGDSIAEPKSNELDRNVEVKIFSPEQKLANDAAEQARNTPDETFIQRKCAHCEEEKQLHRKPSFLQTKTEAARPSVSDSLSRSIESSKGSGSSMDESTQSFMSERFDADFSKVRIHANSESVQMNQQLNAKAFTTGSDIYFNEGQYQPHSTEGKTLLAHELTHVIQQKDFSGEKVLNRRPGPQENIRQTFGDDFVILEQELLSQQAGGLYPGMLERGYVKIEILNLPEEKAALFPPPQLKTPVYNSDEVKIIGEERPWITLDPPPPLKSSGTKKAIVLKVTRRINIRTNNGVEGRINLTAQTTLSNKVQITKTTPKEIVEQLFNYPFGTATFSILFNHKFPGDRFPDSADPIHDEQVTSLNDIIRAHTPDLVGYNFSAQQQYDAAIKIMLAYVPHSALGFDDPKRKIKGKEFKTFEGAQKEAASLGKKDTLIVQSADGKFLVYQLTQMDLFRIANELRSNDDNDNSVDWHNQPNKVKVERILINGKEISLNELRENLYYVDPDAATIGRGKVEKEAIIYKMQSSGFFARKPITHAEALEIWKNINEKMEFPEQIGKAHKLPEGQFISLYAKGVGSFHSIDADHIEGKRIYFKNIDNYNRDVKVVNPQGKEYSPMSFDIFTTTGGPKLFKYVHAELDHGAGEDTHFRESLKDKKYVQDALFLLILGKLDQEAHDIALDVLNKTYGALKALSESDDALRNLILSLPKMNKKERLDILSMMGVEEDRKELFTSILAEPKVTAQIAFGIPVKTISFQVLRSGMQKVVNDTSKVIQQIKNYELFPLRIEGEFGNIIRNEVYKNNGFTKLTGSNYPHQGQTKGFFPTPLSGNEFDFSGMLEQIYGNMAAHMDHATLVMKISTIGLVAVVTAAIIILSGGIGAGVAAVFFEAGTAAFVVTEIAVTAAAMTIMSEGLSQALGQGALGRDKEYYGFDELAKSFGENLALSFIFAGVGRIMKNASAVWRLTATGTLFLGYSLGRYYLENKKLPQGRDLYLFIYENLITLAAIEAGSVLARPLTKMFYAKGLEIRVELINKKISELKLDIGNTQKKLAAKVATGTKIEKAEGLQMLAEQRALLERERNILKELSNSAHLTTEIDVKAELQKVEEAIEKIKLAEFQSKIDFKLNRFGSDKVGYKPGQASVKEIIDFYGKDNVTGPDKDGFIQVKLPDDSTLTFYPETKEADVSKAALQKPAAKLSSKEGHSIDVAWNNIDQIPPVQVAGVTSAPMLKAGDFVNEKGNDMYDMVYDGRYYVKYDAVSKRLLVGDIQNGAIIGFYIDDGNIHADKPFSEVIIKDPLKDIPVAIEKLKVYLETVGTAAPVKTEPTVKQEPKPSQTEQGNQTDEKVKPSKQQVDPAAEAAQKLEALKTDNTKRIAELKQEKSEIEKERQKLIQQIDARRSKINEWRKEANAARTNKNLGETKKGKTLLEQITTTQEKQEIEKARASKVPEWKIQDTVLTQKANEAEKDLVPLEAERNKLNARQVAIDLLIDKLSGVFKIPDKAGGSYKSVFDKAPSGGEVNHIPPDTAYSGIVGLTYNEGPAIWMTKEDHQRTASWGSSKEAQAHQDIQRELIRNGKFREAVQLDINDIRNKFKDGRYEKGIQQALSYLDSIDPAKLKPK
jgi:hypothetical protein